MILAVSTLVSYIYLWFSGMLFPIFQGEEYNGFGAEYRADHYLGGYVIRDRGIARFDHAPLVVWHLGCHRGHTARLVPDGIRDMSCFLEKGNF